MTVTMTSRTFALLGTALLLAGCVESYEGTRLPNSATPVVATGIDGGIDASPLSALQPGIFIDPDGCQIWMIDDGLEGYWSRRVDRHTGLPVCTPIAPPGSIVGDIGVAPGIVDRVPRIAN